MPTDFAKKICLNQSYQETLAKLKEKSLNSEGSLVWPVTLKSIVFTSELPK